MLVEKSQLKSNSSFIRGRWLNNLSLKVKLLIVPIISLFVVFALFALSIFLFSEIKRDGELNVEVNSLIDKMIDIEKRAINYRDPNYIEYMNSELDKTLSIAENISQLNSDRINQDTIEKIFTSIENQRVSISEAIDIDVNMFDEAKIFQNEIESIVSISNSLEAIFQKRREELRTDIQQLSQDHNLSIALLENANSSLIRVEPLSRVVEIGVIEEKNTSLNTQPITSEELEGNSSFIVTKEENSSLNLNEGNRTLNETALLSEVNSSTESNQTEEIVEELDEIVIDLPQVPLYSLLAERRVFELERNSSNLSMELEKRKAELKELDEIGRAHV